jgi:hypothetical protein
LDLRFYFDPVTDHPHIFNHDVDEVEVAEVLMNPGEDRPGRQGSRVAIGLTSGGHSSEANRSRLIGAGRKRSSNETQSVPHWLERS